MSEDEGKMKNDGVPTPLLSSASTRQQQQSAAVSTRIISGSVGSIVTALCVTPLEVVKVHLQNAKPNTASVPTPNPAPVALPQNVSLCPKGCGTFVLNNGLLDCVLPKCAVPYFDDRGNLKCLDTTATQKGTTTTTTTALKPPKAAAATTSSEGTFAMMRSIFVKEGFQGIYAGLAPTLVMGVPSTVFYYTVYDEMVARARARNNLNNHSTIVPDAWIPFWAGSSARLCTTLLTAPLELVRTRQASRVGAGQETRGMMAEIQHIVRHEGCGALYKGLSPTLWRDVPFSGIYWVCLEQFRTLFTTQLLGHENNSPHGRSPSAMEQAGISFLSGASAGMVAAACTTPFDVVKTRQQSETLVPTVARAELEACCNHDGHVVYRHVTAAEVSGRSVWSALYAIYETEGVSGLWRGNQTRMIKVAPSCAIMIMCYEAGKRWLTPSSTAY